jgi:hypothetical protein
VEESRDHHTRLAVGGACRVVGILVLLAMAAAQHTGRWTY